METAVVMPKLGLIMTEGTIMEWLKSEGDAISEGEPLLVVETEKAEIEVEAPASGILRDVVFQAGAKVPVLTRIATIMSVEAGKPWESVAPEEPESAAGELLADGLDKRQAEQARDQLQDQIVELSTLRRVAAERLTESFKSAPHFYLTVRADMSALCELRNRLLAEPGKPSAEKTTITDMLVWFTYQCLRKHPDLNARWEQGTVRLLGSIGIALAITTEKGLVTPVLRDEELKSIDRVAQRRFDLVSRARSGKLLPDDFEGGTFTVTNLGMFGVDTFHPIINPPQCAILAVGAIKDTVLARAGQPAVCPVAHFTLAADHRVLDGAAGASFLRDLVEIIENPGEVWGI
jgi:pyruvate dehydrogenase E2 component (dihydrolipoamide acetyltransferase)